MISQEWSSLSLYSWYECEVHSRSLNKNFFPDGYFHGIIWEYLIEYSTLTIKQGLLPMKDQEIVLNGITGIMDVTTNARAHHAPFAIENLSIVLIITLMSWDVAVVLIDTSCRRNAYL